MWPYTMDNSKFIVSIQKEEFISTYRLNPHINSLHAG